MKSSGVNMGNINLKGKKTKDLGCHCCTAIDLREKERERLDRIEMEEAKFGRQVNTEGGE